MKNQNIHIVAVVLLLLILSGCGIRKILTKNSARAAEHKEVEMTSLVRKDQASLSGRGVMFSDSSRHNYQVLIFPRDSFSYSMQDGFRGTAKSIEITGSAAHLTKSGYQELGFNHIISDSNQTLSEVSRKMERIGSKAVTKRNTAPPTFILIALALIILYPLWKYRSIKSIIQNFR